jgi:hypothetical protein
MPYPAAMHLSLQKHWCLAGVHACVLLLCHFFICRCCASASCSFFSSCAKSSRICRHNMHGGWQADEKAHVQFTAAAPRMESITGQSLLLLQHDMRQLTVLAEPHSWFSYARGFHAGGSIPHPCMHGCSTSLTLPHQFCIAHLAHEDTHTSSNTVSAPTDTTAGCTDNQALYV